jgi:hypothetical protein
MKGRTLYLIGLALTLFVWCEPLYPQSVVTEFAGVPSMKISEGGIERVPATMTRQEAANLHCIISRIGEDYFWASRENKPMVRLDTGGSFITFVAIDGAGYVRVTKPEDKKIAALLLSETEARFDYVEHVLIGLRSVTYYGTVRK